MKSLTNLGASLMALAGAGGLHGGDPPVFRHGDAQPKTALTKRQAKARAATKRQRKARRIERLHRKH